MQQKEKSGNYEYIIIINDVSEEARKLPIQQIHRDRNVLTTIAK